MGSNGFTGGRLYLARFSYLTPQLPSDGTYEGILWVLRQIVFRKEINAAAGPEPFRPIESYVIFM